MTDIPPKHSPETSDYEPHESGSGLVAMYNAASHANAESFPVLKAFQDYIEAERSQARKRVMQLSIFFAVLMVVVVGGFLTAGIAMWRSNDARVNKLLEAVIEQRSAPAPAQPPATLVQTSPLLEESVRQMSRATSELQSSLDKKLDGVNAIASQVNEKVSSQDSELAKLRDELSSMKQQSSKLKEEIAAFQEENKKAIAEAAKKAAAARLSPQPAPVAPPVITASPAISVAPAALAAATPAPKAAPTTVQQTQAKPASDPRYPPAVKEPPVTPSDIKAPDAPKGMIATAIPLKTKNSGTIPWRVMIPD